ncbi:methyl-accepting chemotaxis protein [Burkholderia pseudomallei 305]|nr:methyl-accepting chemotaxis protein [Burkholderia pseudomallei 305]
MWTAIAVHTMYFEKWRKAHVESDGSAGNGEDFRRGLHGKREVAARAASE